VSKLAFGIGDELSVRITSSTRDFEEGINDAQSEALQVSGTLQVLQGRADEAGDELSGAGRDATAAAGGFSALTASTSGLSASFGTLSTVTTVSLIPALAALSTTLAPLAATFGAVGAAAAGLAGAFGAVIGTGMLAFGESLTEEYGQQLVEVEQQIERLEALEEAQGDLTASQTQQLESLKDQRTELRKAGTATGALAVRFGELQDELAPILIQFGEQFVPLIEDALDALPALVQNIVDAAGNMQPFVDALRDFGQAAFEILPEITRELTDLARQSLPLLRDFFGFLRREGPAAFDAMIETTREVGPSLVRFLNALVDATPALLDFGTVILNRVTPALETIVDGLGFIFTQFNKLPSSVQGPVAAFTLLLPVLTSVGSALTTIATLAGGPVTVAIAAFAAAYTTNFANVRTITNRAIGDITQTLGRLEPTLNRLRAIWRVWGDEIMFVVGLVTDTILGAVNAWLDTVVTVVNGLAALASGDFNQALQIYRNFVERVFRGIGNWLEKWFGEQIDAFKQAGIDFALALAAGIKEGADAVVREVEGMAEEMRSYLNGSDADRGPLSDVTQAGRALPQTLAEGIQQGTQAVDKAMRNVGQSAISKGFQQGVKDAPEGPRIQDRGALSQSDIGAFKGLIRNLREQQQQAPDLGNVDTPMAQAARGFSQTRVTVKHELPQGDSVLEKFIRETTEVAVDREFDQRSRRLDRLRERGGR
jgi:phage-related protein